MAGRRGSSGGDFEPPQYEEGAKDGLWSSMKNALKGNRKTSDVGFLVNLLGGKGRGGGTGKLADRISEETGENRRSVLRRIQRSLKGEAKGTVDKGTGVVEQEMRGNSADVMRATGGGVNVSMKASITVSAETYPTERTARAHLTGQEAENFAGAIENGAYDDAANIVFAAYWGEQAGDVQIHEFGEIIF